MKKLFSVITKYGLLFAFFSCLGLMGATIWLHRAVFFQPFDYHYVRQFYDHSHWTVALSERKMGDALLYQLAGYELVTKQSFTEINPEAPPLGKYLLGLSIVLTGNALWVNVILYVLVLLFSYLLIRRIFVDNKRQALALFLIGWQSLVWQQLFQSMLDLGQLAWFLGWSWCIWEFFVQKTLQRKLVFILVSGLFLGLFLATKIAIFAIPLVFIISIWFGLHKRLFWILPMLGIASIVYALSYLPYILTTSLGSAIELQKWIANYWLSSNSKAVPGITLLSLATGVYLGHWKNAQWSWLTEWHPAWLVGSWGVLVALVKKKVTFVKLLPSFQLLLLFLLALIMSLSLVPLFSRYLLIAIPFLAITTIWLLDQFPKQRKRLLYVAIGWSILQSLWLLPPSVGESTKEIERLAAVPAYQELWYFVDHETQKTITRDDFWIANQSAFYDSNVNSIAWDIDLPTLYSNWQTKIPVTLHIIYDTDIGLHSFDFQAQMIRRDGGWRLQWQWDYIFPRWNLNRKIITDLDWQKGKLLALDGSILVEDGMVPTVYITPGNVADEQRMNRELEHITGIKKPYQELLYKVSQLPADPVEVGPVLPYVSLNEWSDLDPAISITYKKGRVFAPEVASDEELVAQLREIDNGLLPLYTASWGSISVVDPNNPEWNEVVMKRDQTPVSDFQTKIEIKEDTISNY